MTRSAARSEPCWILAGVGLLAIVTAGLSFVYERDAVPARSAAPLEGTMHERVRLLTVDKHGVDLGYELRWRVSDPARFETALHGDGTRAGMMLARAAESGLRSFAGRRREREMAKLTGHALGAEALEGLDKHAVELGVEIVEWRIVEVKRSGT